MTTRHDQPQADERHEAPAQPAASSLEEVRDVTPADRHDEAAAEEAALSRARKRVKAVRDFYGHLAVYLVVNAVLVFLDIAGGRDADANSFLMLDWAYFPLIGWGLFVLVHGLTVFWFEPTFGERWEERKLQQYLDEERERERRRQVR